MHNLLAKQDDVQSAIKTGMIGKYFGVRVYYPYHDKPIYLNGEDPAEFTDIVENDHHNLEFEMDENHIKYDYGY